MHVLSSFICSSLNIIFSVHTHEIILWALWPQATSEVCRCCGPAQAWLSAVVCEYKHLQLLGCLSWSRPPWQSCAGQCLDDTLGLSLQGLKVVQACR